MSDLIDRKALMREFATFVRASNNSDFAPVPNWNDAVSLVGSAPTVDAVERKTGKWIKHSIGHKDVPWGFDCSACGEWFVIGEDTAERYNYCPNCGAEMERSEDGQG